MIPFWINNYSMFWFNTHKDSYQWWLNLLFGCDLILYIFNLSFSIDNVDNYYQVRNGNFLPVDLLITLMEKLQFVLLYISIICNWWFCSLYNHSSFCSFVIITMTWYWKVLKANLSSIHIIRGYFYVCLGLFLYSFILWWHLFLFHVELHNIAWL